MCALWSDSVFINDEDHLENVEKEINKSAE